MCRSIEPKRVVLLLVGSLNPPTNLHLRLFELARDSLEKRKLYSVVGGLLSPVHDSYGKKVLHIQYFMKLSSFNTFSFLSHIIIGLDFCSAPLQND